jgi:hypothetical protein
MSEWEKTGKTAWRIAAPVSFAVKPREKRAAIDESMAA